jgi:deoxyribonuclease-4
MLIGAHVSPAGGPAKAVERGPAKGCQAIHILNHSPRAWRARVYTDEEVADYRAALKGSRIDALLIHAVYLLNCASEDKELRDKSLRALIVALQAGDALGAKGVVLHAGSAKSGKVGPAIKRAGTVIKKALAESDSCPLHLENTAGAGGTLGRSFTELAALIDAAGGDRRLGICLDSCHLYASGFDVRTADGLTAVLDDCGSQVGLDRLGSLHFNDSQVGLGTNRDRHAVLGSGELGDKAAQVWFSEPRFEGLPCILETPGVGADKSANEVARAKELRTRGRRARSRKR